MFCVVAFMLWFMWDFGVCEPRILHVYVTPIFHSLSPPMRLDRQLQLQCDVTADPSVDVSQINWSFGEDSDHISTNRKYTVYTEPSGGIFKHIDSVLTINRITDKELGVYSCEAKNSAGMYRKVSVELALEKEGYDDIIVKDVGYSRGADEGYDIFLPEGHDPVSPEPRIDTTTTVVTIPETDTYLEQTTDAAHNVTTPGHEYNASVVSESLQYSIQNESCHDVSSAVSYHQLTGCLGLTFLENVGCAIMFVLLLPKAL